MRFVKGNNKDKALFSSKKFEEMSRDTLLRFTSLSKGDSNSLVPNEIIEFFIKTSEILEILRLLLIAFIRDLVSLSSIYILLRFREIQ